jgi:hypothetical protein
VRLNRALCSCVFRSRWWSSHTTGSVIGAPAPAGPDIVECRLFADVLLLLKEEGRLRKALHTDVFRHRESEVVLIVCKYVSSPCRRDSVSSGLLTVRVNQDFEGREMGGLAPVTEVSEVCRVVKSE